MFDQHTTSFMHLHRSSSEHKSAPLRVQACDWLDEDMSCVNFQDNASVPDQCLHLCMPSLDS
jgi:hypothetical protein